MIKTVITEAIPQENPEYPKLMRYKFNRIDFICLFSEPGKGVVVYEGGSDIAWGVGHADYFTESEFEPFFGTVALTFEG